MTVGTIRVGDGLLTNPENSTILFVSTQYTHTHTHSFTVCRVAFDSPVHAQHKEPEGKMSTAVVNDILCKTSVFSNNRQSEPNTSSDVTCAVYDFE